jgi:hypothetical protein
METADGIFRVSQSVYRMPVFAFHILPVVEKHQAHTLSDTERTEKIRYSQSNPL